MTTEYATVSIKDLEALMLAASCVTGVYNAVSAHKNDAAVSRTRDGVAEAIQNANRMICAARKIKDPMEDVPPTDHEIDILRSWLAGRADGEDLDPRAPEAISMLRKRLIVMGRLTGTIHWGDKTTETDSSDKVLWKVTERGEQFIESGAMKLVSQSR